MNLNSCDECKDFGVVLPIGATLNYKITGNEAKCLCMAESDPKFSNDYGIPHINFGCSMVVSKDIPSHE